MRIALVSKMNRRGGGASKVAEELTRGLIHAGHEALLHTIRPHEPTAGTQPVFPRPFRRAAAMVSAGSEVVTGQVVFPFELPFLWARCRRAEVIHIHDTWTAVSPLTMRFLSLRRPLVFTLHDCSAFTGGCLYMFDCTRHIHSCGRCPEKRKAHTRLRRLDCSACSIRYKRLVHRRGRYTLVTPSRWLADRIDEARVFGSRARVIPNATDFSIFQPGRRAEARRKLHLTPDTPVVLLSASSLADLRKGTTDALKALDIIAGLGLQPHVLLMGKDMDFVGDRLRLPARLLGYRTGEPEIADAYAAADVFFFPTYADNLPLSIQESMGVGTPVIGYAVGGVPEMIDDGETGHLVPLGDHAALADRAAALLRDRPRWTAMSKAAATRAQQEWNPALFLRRHLDLYRSILPEHERD